MVIQLLVGELPYTWEGEFNPVQFMHQLAYEESISPKIPSVLPLFAKQFVERCLDRNVATRATAKELLEHPFLHTDISDKNMRPAEEPVFDAANMNDDDGVNDEK